MNKTLVATAILAASAATPAFAQEAKPFDGPTVGAVVGYDTFTAGDDEDDGSEGDIAYGIALGYDVNLGSVVIGGEAELTDSGVSASTSDVLVNGDELVLAAGRDLYAGLRVGVPVSKSMLVFAKGGYTNQRFEASYTVGTTTETEGENLDGFRVGGGLEFDFGKPFARVEYRYSDYGSFSDADLDTNRHQVMLTAGLRF